MNLYYIAATNADAPGFCFDQIISAETPQQAVDLWKLYLDLAVSKKSRFKCYPGPLLAADTLIARHPRQAEFAWVWSVRSPGQAKVLSCGTDMDLVGYVAP